MTTGFVPRDAQLVGANGRMHDAWYRYLQEQYQWSGLAGPNFPLYTESIALATAMYPDGVNPPSFATFQGNVGAWSCADSGTSRMHCHLAVPRGYTTGTQLTPFIRWAPATSGAGDVTWEFEYSAASADGAFPAPTTLTITSAAAGVAYQHQDVQGSVLSGLEPGALVLCTVRRHGADAGDTYTDAAFLLGAGLVLQHSAHGTQTVAP